MAKKRPERAYHFRGGIERGARYDWKDGYSETINGNVSYPWSTRTECRKEALADGYRAVFYRHGKKETR